jgi:hypothetical protein
MMMAGNALAATDPVYVHDQIILRAANTGAISSAGGLRLAFSAKETCGYCHNGGTTPDGFDGNGNPLLSYDQIEQHSYHGQLGANQMTTWGVASGAKPWVQSPAHVGNW